MQRKFTRMGKLFPMMAAGVLLAALTPAARADTNDSCAEPPAPSHYVAQAGDSQDAQHFAASREFASGSLELNVCSGDVQVRPSNDGALHLQVSVAKAPASRMGAYVKELVVTPGHAEISLEYPHRLHAVVTLEVPPEVLHSEVNLGAGTLAFNGEGLHGDRQLNVGAGTAVVYLRGDQGYASMEVNVGLGSFHDKRPGGTSSHFVISRHFAGTGQGTLEVNVGAGSVDIEPRRGETD